MELGYPPLILEHDRHPHGTEPLARTTHRCEADNPLCGDRVALCLEVQDGVILGVSCRADGCAIARASASILASRVCGLSLDAARGLVPDLLALAQAGSNPALEPRPAPASDRSAQSPLGVTAVLDAAELEALSAVGRYAARRQCALLAWEALRDVQPAEPLGQGAAVDDLAAAQDMD